MRLVIDEIANRIATHPDLVLKLHEVVASTLGASLNEALALCFDIRLARSSLKFFSLEEVPAIRGPLPTGISDVHFRSDLSALPNLSVQSLIDRDPLFWDAVASRDLEARRRRRPGSMLRWSWSRFELYEIEDQAAYAQYIT